MQWIFCKWNYTRKRQNEDTSISEIKNNWTMCLASQCWFTIILGRCLQTAHFIVRLNFIQWLKNPSNELNQTRSNKRSSVQHCEDWEQFSHSSAGVLKAMPLIMCRHWNLQNDMRYSHSVLRHYGRKEKLKIKKKNNEFPSLHMMKCKKHYMETSIDSQIFQYAEKWPSISRGL